MNTCRIIDAYHNYKAMMSDQEDCSTFVYKGELIASRVAANRDLSSAYILWTTPDGLEECKIQRKDDTLCITELSTRPNFILDDPALATYFKNKDVAEWVDLCHYTDAQGAVHYDSSYDSLPVSTDTSAPLSMGDLRKHVCEMLTQSCKYNQGDTVILVGAIGQCPLLHDLMRKSLGVTTIFANDETGETDNWQRSYNKQENSPLKLFFVGIKDNPSATLSLPAIYGVDYRVVLPFSDTEAEDTKVFNDYTIHDLMLQHPDTPDMQFQGHDAVCLKVRADTDMAGNQWLTAVYADDSRRRFPTLNSQLCDTSSIHLLKIKEAK